MEHYDELGVAPSASPAEIRKAYLALARRFHPDGLAHVPSGQRQQAATRMARINAAWSVLSDRDRRAAYDARHGDPEVRSGATIRDVGDSWTPHHDGGDDGEEYVDPRLLDDTPTGAPTLHRSLTFLPAGLAAAGLGTVIVGFVIKLFALLAVGLLLLAAAALSFLMIPLIALANSSRADRDWATRDRAARYR